MWFSKVATGEFQTLAFSPDSRTIYAGYSAANAGNWVDAWDVGTRTGQRLSAADDPDAWSRFAVSSDGRSLLFPTRTAFVVRDAATGAIVSRAEWPYSLIHATK